MPSNRSENLATLSFWEDVYFADVSVPCRPSPGMPFERCLMRVLEEHAAVDAGQTVIEIGCAPGRWLVFYGERFHADVEGIEYSSTGARLSKANLDACGLTGTVHECDFWDFDPGKTYDLVLSLGFIEHFRDPDAVFARHVELLNPGGRLVLGVPNFQGLNRFLQRWFDSDWLALHNLDALGHRRYLAAAEALGLDILSTTYLGGFDPDMISTRKRGRKLMAPFWHLRYRGFGDRINAWWLSSYLLMVFTRPVAGPQVPAHESMDASASST